MKRETPERRESGKEIKREKDWKEKKQKNEREEGERGRERGKGNSSQGIFVFGSYFFPNVCV